MKLDVQQRVDRHELDGPQHGAERQRVRGAEPGVLFPYVLWRAESLAVAH